MTRTALGLAALVALSLPACNKPAGTPAGPPTIGTPLGTVAATRKYRPGPSFSIDDHRALKVQDGTHLHTWFVTAYDLKGLVARVHVVTDGVARLAREVTYQWDEWEWGDGDARGQIVLLFQDGKPFGAGDRRLIAFSIDLAKTASFIRKEQTGDVTLDAAAQPQMTHVASRPSVVGRPFILFQQLLVPPKARTGSFTLGSDLKSAIEASKGGRTVVQVELEATPQPEAR